MDAMNFAAELCATAAAIGAPGKGILAADESIGTIGKRFKPIGVENTQDNRRKYRQLLFQTKGLGQHISGAIVFEESLFEKTPEGVSFVDLMKAEGIIPGIKVDKGQRQLYGTDGETTTQGMDDLDVRCKKYYAQGARFAKWRAVIKIGGPNGANPSELGIREQVYGLARYAAICQANGLVPIVEPEVLMDGDHPIEVSAVVTERVLAATYKALSDHHVLLEGTILKPNMVRPGADWQGAFDPVAIAQATVRVFQHTIPAAVPTITFLSGGMSETEATAGLNAINALPGKKPWQLSFSFGRALQASVLKAWMGKDENIPAAQAALMVRAAHNGAAQLGKYAGEGAANGNGAAGESLHQANYTY